MKAEFTVISKMTLKVNDSKPTLDQVQYRLECGPNIDSSYYHDVDGIPNEDGQETISQVLIMALSSNIHAAHQLGQRDSAEHLRWAISELERAFVEITYLDTTQTM